RLAGFRGVDAQRRLPTAELSRLGHFASVGEECGSAAGMQKENRILLLDLSGLDVIDQSGHGLGRVDGIKEDPFSLSQQSQSCIAFGSGDAVPRTDVLL